MAKKQASKGKNQKAKPTAPVAEFKQAVKEVMETPEPIEADVDETLPVIDADEFAPVVDAVSEMLESNSSQKVMKRALAVAIKGGVKPAYVTSDGNCFESKNFYQANEHCRHNETVKLYRVDYDSNGNPKGVTKMG